MLLLVVGLRHALRALREKPSHRPGCRDATAVPRPRVRGRPLHVAAKKGPHLISAAEKRFLGRDHHDIGIRREELHDAVGIPRCEPGAEALEDMEQRGFSLRIRPHDQAILTSISNDFSIKAEGLHWGDPRRRRRTHPPVPLARMLLAAINEAVLFIAQSPRQHVARREAGEAFDALLNGLRTIPVGNTR